MVLMAGMLPGVECARRRRLRQGGGEAPCGTRRPSLCLYAGGHDHALLGSSGSKQQRSGSGACEEQHGWWTLDSNAREAKERLDQKLRSQREAAAAAIVVVKRHNNAGKLMCPQVAGTSMSSSHGGEQSATTSASATAAPQREVYTRKEGWQRRRRWFRRLGRRPTPEEEEECAVCLEELRAGEAVAHLPCAHRFHWGCAVPWVQAASRCPVCRAAVHLTSPAPACTR